MEWFVHLYRQSKKSKHVNKARLHCIKGRIINLLLQIYLSIKYRDVNNLKLIYNVAAVHSSTRHTHLCTHTITLLYTHTITLTRHHLHVYTSHTRTHSHLYSPTHIPEIKQNSITFHVCTFTKYDAIKYILKETMISKDWLPRKDIMECDMIDVLHDRWTLNTEY